MRDDGEGQAGGGDAPRSDQPSEGVTPGQRLVAAMRGKATTTMTTDELMELFRGE